MSLFTRRIATRFRIGIALSSSWLIAMSPVPLSMNFHSPMVAHAADENIVAIPDSRLEEEIRFALGLFEKPDPITKGKMKQLESLNLNGRNITNLEGLQYATNIKSLLVSDNDIRDITPLANLTNMFYLNLTYNEHLEDISSLATMTGLEGFRAGWCQIRDVPDLSGLHKLKTLSLYRNQIQNVDFISPIASNLTTLELMSNEIADVSSLANMHNATIQIQNNHILDVSMLDWETNKIKSSSQTITLPTQKTGPSQLVFLNPVLSAKGAPLSPFGIYEDGIYQAGTNHIIWHLNPLEKTGSKSFYYAELDAKGTPYNGGRVTVPYEVVEAGPVTVRYVNTSGEVIAPERTLTGEYSQSFMAEAVSIPTYALTERTSTMSGVYTEEPQTMTFVYDKAEAAPITVTYESLRGKTLRPAKTLTGKLDEAYQLEVPQISGYTLQAAPKNQSGNFTEEPQTVRFVYQANPGGPVTVHYQDETGKMLAPSHTLSGDYEESYQAEARSIAHYTLTKQPSNATGTFTEAPQTVIYTYTRTPGQPVTVSYHSTTGERLHPDRILTGGEGEAYISFALEIPGYHFQQVVGQASGTYTDKPQQVRYLYQPEEVLSGGNPAPPTGGRGLPPASETSGVVQRPSTSIGILSPSLSSRPSERPISPVGSSVLSGSFNPTIVQCLTANGGAGPCG
ncbi:MucBP domain-containing protein [Listeria fleischmannii]|uniref:MucBP domain-containing protein n=1 Tax=Listeria fleischmannii TaxID=1069827 RepID=UPI00162843CA|nr:MucBP domain-containing protein [Listeria fleischmannii]MBC1419089.1 hypothetical protein [Listeria fleischmannii]